MKKIYEVHSAFPISGRLNAFYIGLHRKAGLLLPKQTAQLNKAVGDKPRKYGGWYCLCV